MTETTDLSHGATRRTRPLALKIAVGILLLQALANAAGGVLLLMVAAEDIEHGRDVPALQYVLGYASIAIGVVLLACGVLLVRGVLAARPVVVCLEVLAMVGGLVNVVLGAPQAVVGLVLAGLVLMHLYRAEVTEWFRERTEERTGAYSG